jgi:hypothetical protein
MAYAPPPNPWSHHNVVFGTDVSGVLARIPQIETIREFYYNPAQGDVITMVALGTHGAPNAVALREMLMGLDAITFFMGRYDQVLRGPDGTEMFRRHTVHNLRVRLMEFNEHETHITVNHLTGSTDVKKVMHFVMRVLPDEPAAAAAPLRGPLAVFRFEEAPRGGGV